MFHANHLTFNIFSIMFVFRHSVDDYRQPIQYLYRSRKSFECIKFYKQTNKMETKLNATDWTHFKAIIFHVDQTTHHGLQTSFQLEPISMAFHSFLKHNINIVGKYYISRFRWWRMNFSFLSCQFSMLIATVIWAMNADD